MPSSRPFLVLGTHNRKKGRELVDLLAPHGLEVRTLEDFPNALEVVEDGDSFAANAGLKAAQQSRHLGEWVLADDSGICVDALGGAPGVYSARFAGPDATDDDNNRRLLRDLANISAEKRTAHYVCQVALADPLGNIRAESRDVCGGRIRFEPAGSGGFGYDPLFELPEYHCTFGELGPHVKRVLSHRSRALRAILPQLLSFLHPHEATAT
ncbi:MAG: non-canonical purine NTP pyrophosphatase [Pirellulales bacterium]|nr:non-canonical purine NTP pyrophosphatase [Pirellulales bacterium]